MKTVENEKKYAWLVEICEGKGPVSIQQKCRSLLREMPQSDITERLDMLSTSCSPQRGEALLSELRERHIHVVSVYDEDYPELLRQCPDPPVFLFYSGELSCLHKPCVSLIGARACTTYGIQTTRQIAGQLGRLGFTIVSGLALGIDATAHQAALDVQAATASVLGSGIRVIYPRQHTRLARNIVRNSGIVLSEFPPAESPKPYHFPMRNRIISGLCHATIVVEAEKKSGTLITAQFCLDQGRELFAVPGPLNHPTSKGTHQLISRGEAHIFTSVSGFLTHFESLLQGAILQDDALTKKINDPIMRAVYDSLDAFEPSGFDDILVELSAKTPVSVGELGAKLAEMEAKHLIEMRPGQKYLRNPLYSPGETRP